jgi:hypothetical protein
MGWHLPESDLIDEILLAAGKALYLANQFEFRCKIVLKVAYAEELLRDDPVLSLEELANRIPPDKMLHMTLQALANTPPGLSEDESSVLEKAKDARNYIAHEGAGAIGEITEYGGVQTKLNALRKLQAAVIELVNGDSIVSAWVYQIENPGERMPFMTAN